jgi:curli biogenesis system outer membrane secretion channel CsgG
MYASRLLAPLLAAVSLLSFAVGLSAAADTTVALTVAVSKGASAEERELATSLLTLLEVEAAQDGQLSVVERQQIDLALHELALSVEQSKLSEKKLKLGKLVNADLILTMELLPRKKDAEMRNVLVRIVESLTGAIRGVIATPVELVTVDESAAHIAKYLSAVAARPANAVVTVAVAPFESLGRFHRLKPMELGVRDMIATRLRRWGELNTAGKESSQRDEPAEKDQMAPRFPFLVLQRSNMQQLLKELDLVQSGLVDQSRLPKSLPTRAAAYLVHGTIDERNENGFEIIVSAKLVHAASGKTVRDFELVAAPKDLAQKLAAQVDLIAGFLRHPDGSVSKTPGTLREINETEFMFTQVVKDLRRFGRLTPADFSSRRYGLPKTVSYRFERGGVTRVDTPQYRHTLRKAIDRLESTLFIMPDRADVCYSLAFCYSYHIDGIMNLKRADELLRRVISMDGEGPLGVASLRLLSELCFHHNLGKCAPENQTLALEQLQFAFRKMSEKAKNGGWADIPDLIRDVIPRNDSTLIATMAEEIVRAAETAPKNLQYKLAMNSIGFASNAQFEKWADSDNLTLMQVACRGLGQRAWAKRRYEESANWYLHAANALLADEKMKKSSLVDNFRTLAAGALLKGEKLEDARDLLQGNRMKFEQMWVVPEN